MASREELKAKKEKTSQELIQAALQLSADDGYASLSLRSVARKAGIAPTSFYRHFRDMDELGLAIADQATMLLHKSLNAAVGKMLLQSNHCDASTENLPVVINMLLLPFVETFMVCFENHHLLMRLFLQERTGSSQAMRERISHEFKVLTKELTQHLEKINGIIGNRFKNIRLVAETMVSILGLCGLEMLVEAEFDRLSQSDRTIRKLTILLLGASIK